jgi:predicted MFS family arabinose efflux permease
MTSSVPIDLLQPAMGWRGTFLLLAIATLTSALLVFAVVPEAATGKAPEPWRDNLRGLLEIYLSRAFWQVAPLSAAVIGTAFAVHGLWAARWLADVDHFESPQVVAVLLVMGAGLTLGAGIIGIGVDRLQRLGIRSTTMFGWACLVFILLQLAVLLRVALPAWLIWGAFGGFGAMTVLSYSIIGELFPAQKIGRANGALNVLHVGMAFVLQYAMGLLAARWVPDAAGRLPTVAYRTAFALPLLLELLGIGWFWIAFRTTSQQSTTFEPSETVLR